VSGRLPSTIDLRRLQHSLNAMCGPAISVRRAEWVDDDFDARFSATSRTYRYEVWNDPAPNPLVARTTWHVRTRADLTAMNRAAAPFVGEHDFASFCRRVKVADGESAPSTIRSVEHAGWEAIGASPLLRFEIRATSFCHQMVRSIVGTLTDVGIGRRSADEVPAMIAARSRQAAGQVAPPTGLVLWSVGYDGTRWDA
jgi:tRNA pseudouridine38-40 synthase